MLGLGSSIIASSAPNKLELIATYTADWSSGVDSWTDIGLNDTPFTIARIASFGGSDGAGGTVTKNNVLQVDVNADETGLSGIQRANPFTTKAGDIVETTFDIYLDSTQGAEDRWSGTDDVRVYVTQPGWDTESFDVEQNKWASISTVNGATLTNATLNQDANTSDTMTNVPTMSQIYFAESVGDEPLEDARFYVANLVVKQYRSTLFG